MNDTSIISYLTYSREDRIILIIIIILWTGIWKYKEYSNHNAWRRRAAPEERERERECVKVRRCTWGDEAKFDQLVACDRIILIIIFFLKLEGIIWVKNKKKIIKLLFLSSNYYFESKFMIRYLCLFFFTIG